MSDEETVKKNYWEKYKGQTVLIQLRAQPYVGVTSVQLEPVMLNDEQGVPTGQLHQTPILRGTVVAVEGNGEMGARMTLETSDPNPQLVNTVEIDLDPDRDIGFLSVVKKSLIIA